MIREVLTNEWKMKEVGSADSYNIAVPASVLSVLIEKKVIEDPVFSDNEEAVTAVLEKDYEFTRVITITGEYMREDEIDLIFYGLDTLTDIYLNNERLAATSNMHRTYRFSIKDKVRAGANELKVVFHSTFRYLDEYVSEKNKSSDYVNLGSIKGNQYLRKSFYMFGSKNSPVLPDMGIFRDAVLEAYSKARIEEVFFDQIHDGGEVKLYVDPILKITDNIPLEIVVSVSGQDNVSKVIRMPDEGQTKTRKNENEIMVAIKNPKLWWPNNMGEQNLYDVKITIKKSDTVFDEKEYKIGLRTLTVSREKDDIGEEFAFVVNGVKMFAFGANYLPEEVCLSKITAQKQEKIIKSAAKANLNCLRVWGGGYYPNDDFYDLCDKYGLVVWQDLMFVKNTYELTPMMEEEITSELIDNVTRIRHHASLGLWCGNDKLEKAWVEEFDKESSYLKADYVKLFEYLIPIVVRKTDDMTFFWPSSPSSGGCFDNPSDNTRGDSHFNGIWEEDINDLEYEDKPYRFVSELGFQSLPSLKTIETFTKPNERNVFSYIMGKHQREKNAYGKCTYYMSQNFQYPLDFESFIYVSQILQGYYVSHIVEHFRRKRAETMGTILWHLSDTWPSMSYSAIDYFGRWKPFLYMAKDFFRPVAGSVMRSKDKSGKANYAFRAYVVNDSVTDMSFKVKQTLYDITTGKELVHFEDNSRAFSGRVVELKEHDYERYVRNKGERNVFLEAQFMYSNGYTQIITETFVPYKDLNLKNPTVNFTVTEMEEAYLITLESDTFTPFVYLDLFDKDAVFERNVITLNGNRAETIELKKAEIEGEPFKDADDLCDHLDIWYLQKSYMLYDETIKEEDEEEESKQ